jgi:hypothetical protein
MKKYFLIPAYIGILLSAGVFAQVPETMSYQAVVRDLSNNLVLNKGITMKISLLEVSIYGASVYVETHSAVTNSNGLVNIELGTGTVLNGKFALIDWTKSPYFIKTEIDPQGGTNYIITGISQLLSVPYALYAKTADSVRNETDPTIPDDVKNINTGDINNWNTAFSWGNHSTANYAESQHSHSANDITTGKLSIEILPTGISSATVALGNHTHSEYLTNGLINSWSFINNCPGILSSITTSYQLVANLGSINKKDANSAITVSFNGRVSAETLLGTGVIFELRINGAATTSGVARAVLKKSETGSDGVHVNMTGIWKNLPEGPHTLSIFAIGMHGTGTNARIDPGCWSSAHTLVTEIR